MRRVKVSLICLAFALRASALQAEGPQLCSAVRYQGTNAEPGDFTFLCGRSPGMSWRNGRGLLARIGQAIAPAAGKELSGAVQQRHAPPAVAAVSINRTDEPRPFTSEVARCPGNWHALFDGFPVALFGPA
jgi:hypothetical protein